MRNFKNMILEFHGQLEQFTKATKRGKRKKLQSMKANANKSLMSLELVTWLVVQAISIL